MRSFTLLTSTPALLTNFLEARGIIQQNPDGSYSGVLPGMEWVKVANPIETAPGVQDTRHVYQVKFSGKSLDKAPGFKQWLDNNTTKVTAPANYMIRGEPLGDAWKVNGQNVWLVPGRDPTDLTPGDDPSERFGVWQ